MLPQQEEWLKALRSGEYKQANGTLHTRDKNGEEKFCCLGVACNLAVKAGIIPQPKEDKGFFEYGGAAGILPDEVRDWMGFYSSWGSKIGPEGASLDEVKLLTYLNDHEGYDFEEIANYVELNFDNVFKRSE